MKHNHNKTLLEKINKTNTWRHYTKTKPVWARKLKQDETVNTIEGQITYRAGNYLCKGPSGDMWGQEEATLLKKYAIDPESAPDGEGWQKYLPVPDAAGVMATTVHEDFSIKHPLWGTFQGHAGDYLVKSYDEKEAAFPEDIWIVKKEIFEGTYDAVE